MNDVLIVGAGLAGSAAAIHLSRKGYAVEVLDQATFPRRKACGEGLFSPGVQELKALGVVDSIADAAELRSMSFSRGSATVEAPLPPADMPHLGVRRDLLDEALFNAATEAGARMTSGVQVRKAVQHPDGYYLETTAGNYEGRIIIAADGINSRLRRDAGLDRPGRGRRFGISAHMQVGRAIPPTVQVIFEADYEVYITPVSAQIINVALLLGHPAALTFKGNLKTRFLELLAKSGIKGDLIDEPLMAGPFPARAKRLAKENLVLAGDAAGFLDPITGEGMSLALRSARLCADSVAAFLEDGDAATFEGYGRAHRRLSRNPVMLARLMLFLAGHRSLGHRAILNLKRHPETLTRLIAINNGIAGFQDLRPRDLTALLLGR